MTYENVPEFSNVLTHNFQDGVLSTGASSSGFLIQIRKLWEFYIEEFFHGDEDLYHKRKEPYIYYKHLFRQFLWSRLQVKERIREIEGELTGRKPNHATIYNSLDKDPNYFKLTQKELTEALIFLNKHMNVDLQSQLKTAIMKAKNNGYTIDDIARNFRVHEDVIKDIIDNKQVSLQTLKLMESEL